MSDELGERVALTVLRRRLRFFEDSVREAGVALVVTDYAVDAWVFAPVESLRCLPLGPERRTTSDFHVELSRLADRVNESQRPIVFTRCGADRWVMAPLCARDAIRAVLHQLKHAGVRSGAAAGTRER